MIKKTIYLKSDLNLGSETYKVIFSKFRKKSIALKVKTDGSVQIMAPMGTELSRITNLIEKRKQWLEKHVQVSIERLSLTPIKQYTQGETHLYLGKNYALSLFNCKEILDETQKKTTLCLCQDKNSHQDKDLYQSTNLYQDKNQTAILKKQNNELQIYCPNPNSRKVKLLLDIWYKKHAQRVFNKRLWAVAQKISWLDFTPKLQIKEMRRQWGNCSAKNIITLNLNLIKAPLIYIDYVLAHELCHLKEKNHSSSFYNLLKQVCPNWKDLRLTLHRSNEFILPQ